MVCLSIKHAKFIVIPAKAGIQKAELGSCLRRNDDIKNLVGIPGGKICHFPDCVQ